MEPPSRVSASLSRRNRLRCPSRSHARPWFPAPSPSRACHAGKASTEAGASAFATVADSVRLHPGEAVIGALPMSQPIHVEIALKLRNRARCSTRLRRANLAQKPGQRQVGSFADVRASDLRLRADAGAGTGGRGLFWPATATRTSVIAPNRLLVSADGTASSARGVPGRASRKCKHARWQGRVREYRAGADLQRRCRTRWWRCWACRPCTRCEQPMLPSRAAAP